MEAGEAAPPRAGVAAYLALLRTNRNFRLIWLGEFISSVGMWFTYVRWA